MNLTNSSELVERQPFEFYKNNEFQQVVYSDRTGHVVLTDAHKIVVGDRIKLVVQNDLVYENNSIEYELKDLLKS